MGNLEASEDLVDEELDVVVREGLLSDDVGEVSSHQVGDEVDILEVLVGSSWSEHVQQTHHLGGGGGGGGGGTRLMYRL